MKKYLTPKEVAELLMVSPVTIRQWAQKGMLTFKITAGGHRRYVAADVEAFKAKYGLEKHALNNDGLRVLVVDDEDSLREMLVIMIQEYLEDTEVETAADGFEAGIKVQSFSPDIILLDLMMPGLNGLDVCKMLKSDEKTKHIRVIAMTGYPGGKDAQEIIEAGAEECLSKPLDKKELIEKLKKSIKAS